MFPSSPLLGITDDRSLNMPAITAKRKKYNDNVKKTGKLFETCVVFKNTRFLNVPCFKTLMWRAPFFHISENDFFIYLRWFRYFWIDNSCVVIGAILELFFSNTINLKFNIIFNSSWWNMHSSECISDLSVFPGFVFVNIHSVE